MNLLFRNVSVCAAALLMCSAAMAQNATGPFVGEMSENWESFRNYQENPNTFADHDGPVSIMNGAATISHPGSGSMLIYEPAVDGATFGLGLYGSAQTVDGSKGMGISSAFTNATITFDEEVMSFGAWWGATGFDGPSAPLPINFSFYDANGSLIGSDAVQYSAPNADGALMWGGWTFDVGVKSIVYSSHFVAVDGLQASSTIVPVPGTLALLAIGGLVGTRRRRV